VHFNPDVEQAISTSRLSTYRSQSVTDDHARQLYRWNIELSAALGPLTADLEVTLRNTIHDRLSIYFGRRDWWASPSLLLDDITTDMLTKVVAKHQKKIVKGTVGPGKVIADTTLGVWVHLLGRGGHSALGRAIDYETNLWRLALRHGFFTGTVTKSGRPRRPSRADVHKRASMFQRLRNRAAHHEPILNGVRVPGSATSTVSLLDAWEQGVELLGWMSPELAELHRDASTLPRVFEQRPSP